MMHNDMGHFGFKKTFQRIKDKYFWPQMSSEIEDWCRKCEVCQRRRNPVPSQRAPLQSISTCRPGELVTMDIVEYAQSSRGYRYCLVMIDHFTKWLELFPLRNQKAETIAKKVFDGWIPRHGAPEQLHHDQGKNLTAEIIREVCSFLEIWNTRTTPFHPQSDGASERSIRTVNNMLAKVVAEDQRNCDLYVPSTCFAYNTAVHSTTGYTPSYLEYGRELRLPSDLVMKDQQTPKNNSHTEYATGLKKRLAKAFECSRETLESSHRTQKHYYDRWARGNIYKEGDLVMWKDQKTRNGSCMKLNKPWTGLWKVIKRLGEVVYRIKYIGSNKVGLKRRIVHHNQLKRFYETTGSQEEPVQSEQISGQLVANDGDTVESRSDVVIVVDGPGADDEHEIQQREVEPVVLEPEGRPQRQRRPPAWLVPYEINI